MEKFEQTKTNVNTTKLQKKKENPGIYLTTKSVGSEEGLGWVDRGREN